MDEEHRQRRRAQKRRRRVWRRRLTAAGALLVVVVAVVLVVLSTTGGTPRPPVRPRTARDVAAAHRSARARKRLAAAPKAGSTAAVLAAGDGHPGHVAVPVLMYHVIAAPPPGAPFPLLYVQPAQFTQEMAALKQQGWHPVTLDQLRANWMTGARLPAGKPIVITFDNGYHSQYAAALPILRRMGWVADENIQLSGLPPSQGGLTTGEIRGLVNAGWELDTQGISHADLITLDATQLQAQVASSRTTIQRRYHVPVNWFCYPSGQYDAAVIDAVKAAGYVGSTTVIPGWATPSSDPYRLPRLRVVAGTSGPALIAQIASTRTASPPPSSYGGT